MSATSRKKLVANPARKKSNVQNYYKKHGDYRGKFFRKNPGLFGSIWFCHYCFKPLFGKTRVEVDHVAPKSKVKIRAIYNLDGNLVPACRKCNRKKSNKMGFIVVRGYIGKLVGFLLSPFAFVFETLVKTAFGLVAKLFWFLIGTVVVIWVLKGGIF